MRIIAGTARGRKIIAPDGQGTRPITDRAKEAIFNMLVSLGGVEDAIVFDLFAGSGSFGLESLSRGARHVTFVENDRRALKTLEENIRTLGFSGQTTILSVPVERAVQTIGHADIAFCDPPYRLDVWQTLFDGVDADLLVGHAERPIELADGWVEERRRKYGRAKILIASRSDLAGTDAAEAATAPEVAGLVALEDNGRTPLSGELT